MKLNVFRATRRPPSGPETALAASGFAYVESCWMCSCWTLTAHVQQLFTYAKPEAASAVLGS